MSLGIKDYNGTILSFIPSSSCHFTHSLHVLFSSPSSDCSQLRSEIYGILQGLATPDVIAMNSGSQPDWTRVITQECPVSLQVQLAQEFKEFKKESLIT